MTRPTLIVGLGSHQGDDRAGWLVADRLAACGTAEMEIRHALSPWDLPGWLDGRDELLICDACRGSGSPGAWQRWIWPDTSFAQFPRGASHDFPLTAALQLAELLGVAPRRILIWTIELAHTDAGSEVSLPVRHAVDEVVADILRSVRSKPSGNASNN